MSRKKFPGNRDSAEKKNENPAFIKSHNIGTRRHSSKLLGHSSKPEKSVMFFMLFLCTAGSELLKFALSGDCFFFFFSFFKNRGVGGEPVY